MNNKINPFIEFDLEPGEELRLMTSDNYITSYIKENYYYISSYGKVFSMYNANKTGKGYRMKPSKTKDGYLQEPLVQKDKSDKSLKISRLVLSYFGDPIDNYDEMEANHLNFNRENNDINNLNWMSHDDNLKYSENNRYRKIDDNAIIDIFNRVNINGESYDDVAKIYNCTASTIKEAAHGINEFAKKHEKLGLHYNKLNHGLTPEEIKEIYKALMRYEDPEVLSKKYNISIPIIDAIRCKGRRFKKYLEEFPDIYYNKLKFTEEEILNIHKLAVSGMYSISELEKMFNITSVTIYKIKFCRKPYEYLIEKYHIIPPNPNLDYNKTPTELALKICEMSKTMTANQISWKTGISIATINDIRFCRDGFEYLISDYGIKPSNERTCSKNSLSEKMVLKIYNGIKNNNFTIPEASKIYQISNSTIYNIAHCLKSYSYLKTKYNLEPLSIKELRQKRIDNLYSKKK